MVLDTASGQSRIGSQTGGLSGPAIRPITLRLAWEAAKSVRIPVVGLGGVEKVEDVLEYLVGGGFRSPSGHRELHQPGSHPRARRGSTAGSVFL